MCGGLRYCTKICLTESREDKTEYEDKLGNEGVVSLVSTLTLDVSQWSALRSFRFPSKKLVPFTLLVRGFERETAESTALQLLGPCNMYCIECATFYSYKKRSSVSRQDSVLLLSAALLQVSGVFDGFYGVPN